METNSSLRTLNALTLAPSFNFRSRPYLFRPLNISQLKTKFPSCSSLSFQRFFALCSFREEGGSGSSLPQGAGEAVKEVSRNKLFQVVLVSPQIPGNTGCIARTCAASAVGLHLVGPLGFQVDDTKLKRAGLDYWPYVVVKVHSSWGEFRDYFRQQEGEKRLLAFTKRGTAIHSLSFGSFRKSRCPFQDTFPPLDEKKKICYQRISPTKKVITLFLAQKQVVSLPRHC